MEFKKFIDGDCLQLIIHLVLELSGMKFIQKGFYLECFTFGTIMTAEIEAYEINSFWHPKKRPLEKRENLPIKLIQ